MIVFNSAIYKIEFFIVVYWISIWMHKHTFYRYQVWPHRIHYNIVCLHFCRGEKKNNKIIFYNASCFMCSVLALISFNSYILQWVFHLFCMLLFGVNLNAIFCVCITVIFNSLNLIFIHISYIIIYHIHIIYIYICFRLCIHLHTLNMCAHNSARSHVYIYNCNWFQCMLNIGMIAALSSIQIVHHVVSMMIMLFWLYDT